jgi:hypothetical protein
MACAAFVYAPMRTNSLVALCAMNASPSGPIQRCLKNSPRVSIPTRLHAPIAAAPFGKTPRTGRISKKYACSDGTTKSKSLALNPTQTPRRSPSLNELVDYCPKNESF